MMQVVSPLMMQSHKELLKVKMLRERWSQSQKQTDILDRKKGGQTLRQTGSRPVGKEGKRESAVKKGRCGGRKVRK